MKRPSEVGYWELIEMPESGVGWGGCLRQKKTYRLLKVVINFWISEVKKYEENMGNKQSQNERGGIKSIGSHTQKA